MVRMCGRNPDRPTDRTPGLPTEQRLEPNAQGISGCLTSVQKDNLVLESQILTPKRTEYGKLIRKAYENGEIRESRRNMTELAPRQDGTITTVQKDNELLEIVKIKQATSAGAIECEIGGCFDASFPGSRTRRGRVQDNGNTAPTLTAQNQEIMCIETQYRIRKLTPRECGRLMGVSDEDITKMAEVNSNSQLYKQFGNSIVVDVMCEMFKNLGIGRRNEQQTNDEKSTAGKAHETDHRQP
ncbi:DNA cytosine methyltransferase [Oscillospiraceae bacterium Marseille-Q3528]|nr:DNA cytosine methyltransferase [Oscillospiraceae bacterium Marseille-Q3528]